jgi:hypothetical protein
MVVKYCLGMALIRLSKKSIRRVRSITWFLKLWSGSAMMLERTHKMLSFVLWSWSVVRRPERVSRRLY